MNLSFFNTASGMDCMQYDDFERQWEALGKFQYRKRYGLHAMQRIHLDGDEPSEFQYRKRYGLHAIVRNENGQVYAAKFQYRKRYGLHAITAVVLSDMLGVEFQYRKRYGLHAIPSLTALGTAEPRSGFSKRIALFGRSPQPRGIFLSPKSAENVRKPCNIKETFVHGKNLKLMAFSREFLPSL